MTEPLQIHVAKALVRELRHEAERGRITLNKLANTLTLDYLHRLGLR